MRSRVRTWLLASGAVVAGSAAFLAWGLRTRGVPKPALAGELRSAHLTVQGHRRTFRYYVPPHRADKRPLVLVFHGSAGSGAQIRRQTAYEFDVLADRHGFVVAYPDGHEGYWNDCRRGHETEARRLGIDDVAFVKVMIGWFEAEHGVARDRVMAFGLSNGGHLAYRLAYEAPDVARAVVADAASLPAAENQLCRPAGQPAAVLVINGTGDPINPYEGGEVSFYRFFVRRGTVVSTMDTVRYWAAVAGHAGEPSREPIPDADPADGAAATRLTWASAERPEVSLVSVQGGGHTIPHPRAALPRILGRTCRDFSAAEEAWRFFARQIGG